jgi:drug/metabolite transporter (DMT)-like permease
MYRVFGTGISASHLNLYKSIVALACLLAVLLMTGQEWDLGGHEVLYLSISGLFGLSLGDSFFFVALKKLGAQLASSVQCLGPPLAGIMAMFWLDEALSTVEWIGIVVTVMAVSGVIYFSRGNRTKITELDPAMLWSGVLFAILSAVCQAFSWVIARDALQNVSVVTGTVVRIGAAALFLLAFSFAGRDRSYKLMFAKRSLLATLTVAAFFGSFVGVTLLSVGAKYAKAGISSTLASTYPIWVIPIAFFILKEKISVTIVACTGLAVCGISLIFLS